MIIASENDTNPKRYEFCCWKATIFQYKSYEAHQNVMNYSKDVMNSIAAS